MTDPHAIDATQPLVVMYHYVWAERPPEPAGVRPLLGAEFETQLDALSTRYEICDATTFLDRRAHGWTGKPPCLLTFDDGTADHATIVTPILARRGLSGVFFVLSGPAEEGLMPLTHAVHWALSVGDDAVWMALVEEAHASGVSTGDPAIGRKMYHYEPPLRADVKYAANVALPPQITQRALDRLARQRGTTLAALARDWFVSAEQIRSMHAAGMTIGVHGHTHRSLQQMGLSVGEEMRSCAAMIRRVTGEAPTWWACPFGGTGAPAAFHQAMLLAMNSLGIVGGVSTVARSVSPRDQLLRLPRIDCVSLPPRKAW